MSRSGIPSLSLSILAALIMFAGDALAQVIPSPSGPLPKSTERIGAENPFTPPGGISERMRDGRFEITVKSPDVRRISADDLVRDPDLGPGMLYKVRAGGYLAFDETEWVEKVEFKAFDIPLIALDQYKKLAETLSIINTTLAELRTNMASYGQYGMRLINICGVKKFDSFSDIDKPIAEPIAVYRDLTILRDIVVNALNRLAKDRTCVDRGEDYTKNMDHIRNRLTTILKEYDRVRDRALEDAGNIKSGPERGGAPR